MSESRFGPTVPDNSMVICPACTSQFVAISVDDQRHRSELAAQLARAREWMQTHGRHGLSCMELDIYDERDHGCTCGLTAFLKEIGL